MKKIYEILQKINDLTYIELINEMNNLDLQNISAYPIFKGTKIYRARPTNNNPFKHIDELSFNPWPKRFDRASSPCYPMFYGALSANNNDYPMLTNFAELNNILRSKGEGTDEQEIAIAEFDVIEDFYTGALIFCKEFLAVNTQYQKLYTEVKNNSPSDFEALETLSYMFSHTEKDQYYDNRLTAAFTEWLLEFNQNIEAIMYPSTRLSGEGTNIALHPMTARIKLECKRIVVTKIYIKNNCVINDYISKTNSINPDGSFELIEITDNQYHKGRDFCIELLTKMNNNNESGE